MTEFHAHYLSRLNIPIIRLALDNNSNYLKKIWEESLSMLLDHKIPNRNIISYALIGFKSDYDECFDRCKWIENHGIKVLPMWFHALDTMEYNRVSIEQKKFGWTEEKRKNIMGYFYKHRWKRL